LAAAAAVAEAVSAQVEQELVEEMLVSAAAVELEDQGVRAEGQAGLAASAAAVELVEELSQACQELAR
jgi:serine kinase of HPr protein (carbohydrate metabolism regulator)